MSETTPSSTESPTSSSSDDSPTTTPPPEDTPVSTTASTSEDATSSTSSCSPTSTPGQVLTAPGCDPLWTLQGVSEDGVNPAGTPFSANIACGSLDQQSVTVFQSGYPMYEGQLSYDDSGVHFIYGFYGPVTVSLFGLDSNGYPFISSFDLVFGYASMSVYVVDSDHHRIPNCELHMTGTIQQQPFTVTMQSDDNGEVYFQNLPYTNVDIKAITPDGKFADAEGVYTGSGYYTLQVADFSGAQDGNWDFSGDSKDGWIGSGDVYQSEQYPCLQSEGICDYDQPIQFPEPLPWWPWLPWFCDNPDQIFGCYCFDFENFWCGLDFYCDDDEICIPFLPCCFPVLLKRESGGATIPRALLERQAAGSSASAPSNGTSDASQGPQYGAVANMTEFIQKLSANAQLRKNDSNVIDASKVQRKNVSTILTTLAKDPKIAPGANLTDGVAPTANITRKRDSALALFGRDPDDNDLFIRTSGLSLVTNTATFNVDSSTKAVFIRFKFITSEFRRIFGTNDDDFVVTIKSDKGDSVRKIVNTIPQYQFDENGATDWMELKLTLSNGATKVRFDMSVENKYDSDYDSALVIDKAGFVGGGCSSCGNCDECSSDPICSDTCQSQQFGTCSFYSDCMESSKPCFGDPSSYALSFGEQNCNRYLTSNVGSTLSGSGRFFAQSAMNCVQNALRPVVNCDATCSNLEQVAFGAQQNCYMQSGFCNSALTCQDYTVALMALGHEKQMLDILRQTATAGNNNCPYAIKSSLDTCPDWQLPSKAKKVVWAAYFGTSYSSVTQDDIDPCGTQPPVSSYTPDPTPDPTPYPTPDPTAYPTPDPTPIESPDPNPTPEPTPTPHNGDYSQYTCDNVGQCYTYTDCGVGNSNGDGCVCGTNVDGVAACFRGATPCNGQDCNVDSDCGASQYCLNANSCCGYPVCVDLDVCRNTLSSREIFRKRNLDVNGEEWTATYVPRAMRAKMMMK
ncbi:hypothetical protein PRZ48_000242 [Zasmidium cellare]|uniref:Uncharacterized protein n=1 Tax=Zasmidium cellare TaxID=395010 RepID=A0ABR0EYI7_ZASCE|nr:hypothetical protein PRZ48_000242 [Zasmidium cellare]